MNLLPFEFLFMGKWIVWAVLVGVCLNVHDFFNTSLIFAFSHDFREVLGDVNLMTIYCGDFWVS